MKSKLVVNCGGMFSGKSSELMRQGERHMLAGHNLIYVKPKLDNRYAENYIVNHNGQKVKAISIDTKDDLTLNKAIIDAQIILIDEAQFIENIVSMIETLLYNNKVIYCSGLDMDYLGKPFEAIAQLMAMADHVNKFHAVCSHCGEDAIFSYKLVKNDNRIELGEKDKYIPLCRSCYYQKN